MKRFEVTYRDERKKMQTMVVQSETVDDAIRNFIAKYKGYALLSVEEI